MLTLTMFFTTIFFLRICLEFDKFVKPPSVAVVMLSSWYAPCSYLLLFPHTLMIFCLSNHVRMLDKCTMLVISMTVLWSELQPWYQTSLVSPASDFWLLYKACQYMQDPDMETLPPHSLVLPNAPQQPASIMMRRHNFLLVLHMLKCFVIL